MNRLLISLSLMTIICAAYAAQIYKWTDGQGNVHFSDTPHQGAEIITIPDSQVYSTPASPLPQSAIEPLEEESVKLKHSYNQIDIAQPANGATIRNNQGFVEVTVAIEPELAPGDKLQLIYDRAAYGNPQKNYIFKVNGMYRGSHTLAVQAIDAARNVIKSSEPITIYVFRPRVGMVPETRVH